jgi:hypothetical protein
MATPMQFSNVPIKKKPGQNQKIKKLLAMNTQEILLVFSNNINY